MQNFGPPPQILDLGAGELQSTQLNQTQMSRNWGSAVQMNHKYETGQNRQNHQMQANQQEQHLSYEQIDFARETEQNPMGTEKVEQKFNHRH